jgi:hypothetical protein
VTPDRARHYLCISLPLLTLLAITYGCATPGEMAERDCNVRHVTWAPIASEGEVTLAWRVDPIQVERNCGHVYGCAIVRGRRVDVWLVDGRSAECTLMTLAHEMRHGMGPPGVIVKHD